jgi:hypothetical protein
VLPALVLLVALAQLAPSQAEVESYAGLLAAASRGDAAEIQRLLAGGAPVATRDSHGRTPLHVAAHGGHHAAARALLAGGADPNALESRRYDLLTIAAVRDDLEMVRLGLAAGANPRAITSPYDGTALIAAAHLGHVAVVRELIEAGAPLDHVNNLGWTALLEAIILGDGGARHTEIVRALVAAGAGPGLADREGTTPLAHARSRGYREMVRMLEEAGARR